MLTLTPTEVLQRVRNAEGSLSPERVTVVGSDHVGDSIRDGVGMDVKRQYQPVRESTSGCKSVRSCMFSNKISDTLTPR